MAKKPTAADGEIEEVTRLHNRPPEPLKSPGFDLTPEEWTEWMASRFENLTARKNELLPSFDRFRKAYAIQRATAGGPPLGIDKWNDDVQGRAGDLRAKLADLIKQAGAVHVQEKNPVLQAGRAIDGFKNRFIADIETAITLIRERQTIYATWQEAENRRKKAAEAERLRQEAERIAASAATSMAPAALEQAAEAFGQAAHAAEEANAPAGDLSRTRGALGSVTSLRTTWKFFPEESNLMDLVKAVAEERASIEYLAFNEVRLNFAVKSEKIREIPGCVIRIEQKV